MQGKSEEKWVYTQCAGCYGGCAMKVKVVDGVMVKAEGVPESDFGPQGGLCGKGHATLMDYYDPVVNQRNGTHFKPNTLA